ncbi:MAG: MFS transporter [Nitrospinae bacterium]|nr:MFS transporter [Nitrospinota bacterium]
MEYLSFAWKNRRFLAFGLLLTFFSFFGQSYFIAVFNTDIRAAFSLSHGEFGLAYAVATVSSAVCLIWTGRLIDKARLRTFALCVCGGLIASCVLMAAAPVFGALLLALFALRLTGQGLMVHTAVTSIGRHFTAERGRAVSIISMGGPSGQAVMALVAVALTAWLSWRQVWLVMAAGAALVLIPSVSLLLRGHEDAHLGSGRRAEAAAASGPRGDWTRGDVLRDIRFYFMMPVLLAPSFIGTGFFFHMGHLVDAKGWSLAFFTGAYTLYTLFSVSLTLLAGPVVDRIGAVRLIPWHLAPMCLGLVALASSDHRFAAILYMCLTGITVGMRITIGGAVWAEIYGVENLGAIRSLATSFMVVSTALSPVVFGWLIDHSVSMESLALMCLAYGAGSSVLSGASLGVGR